MPPHCYLRSGAARHQRTAARSAALHQGLVVDAGLLGNGLQASLDGLVCLGGVGAGGGGAQHLLVGAGRAASALRSHQQVVGAGGGLSEGTQRGWEGRSACNCIGHLAAQAVATAGRSRSSLWQGQPW